MEDRTQSPAQTRLSIDPNFAKACYRKVSWRILPILLLCFVLAYLDRVNVGFAKLHMERDLGFSDAVYGLGAGMFFIAYFFFEIPSNIILHRVGARRWISRIMVTWGLSSAAMIFCSDELHFYALRFLLGIAEAGFFPGVILYLTYWYPAERRARVTSLFMTGMAIAGIIGGPLSGWILQTFDGRLGWYSWQWMYVLEGLPSIVLGFILLAYLDDSIADADWLSPAERNFLAAEVAREAQSKSHARIGPMLRNPKVWLLSAIYFGLVMGLYGISFWLPSLIETMGVKSNIEVGLISAIPWTAAAISMVTVAISADRCRERRWHVAIPASVGAVGLLFTVLWTGQLWLSVFALSLATMGIATSLPLFWSLPTAFLTGSGAAAGIALINSLGNLAGFLSPFIVGHLRDMTASSSAGMYLLSGCLLIAGLLTLAVPARLVNR